jgi:hypothetical protein
MLEPTSGFVGRLDPLRTVRTWILGEATAGQQLRIASISGPGGIGKTFLLEHVLRGLPQEDLAGREYLTLRVAGSGGVRTLAQVVAHDLIVGCRDIDLKKDGFGRTQRCRLVLEEMDHAARLEVESQAKDDPDLAKAIGKLFSFGAGVLEIVPFAPAKVAARLAGKLDGQSVERAVAAVQRAGAYQLEKARLGGVLPGGSDVILRNKLRTSLPDALADALVEDLDELLTPRLLRKPDHWRLLFILDDYEQLSAVLADFLIEKLVPRLARADFQTLMIVLGRDRLVDTHAAWKQSYERLLLGNVALTELSPAETEEYLRAQGIVDPAVIARIVEDTEGYPYLLQGEVESESDGGSSALGIATFFDRTTRWMTEEQKQWALRLAFLDDISLETIPRVIDDAPPEEVLAWFKREGSLRSRSAVTWSMLPIIRSRLRTYLRNDSPRLFNQLDRANA